MKQPTSNAAWLYILLSLTICGLSFSAKGQLEDSIPKLPLFTQCKQFYGGLSTIFEDSKPDRIMTFGPNVGFTYPLNTKWGLTADAGLLFGSNNNTKYTKFQLYGGASYLSIPLGDGYVSLSPHLLAGYSSTRSKYEYENYSFTNSQGGLSLLAGTNVNFPIGRTIVRGTADFNPTFAEGHMHTNVRVGIGIPLVSCTNERTPHTVTTTRPLCKANKFTTELKASYTHFERIAKSTEDLINRIPRFEAKIKAGVEVNVKKGEECCSPDLPPATYTEFRGGVEGSFELNVTLWGIPDIHYSVNLWPFLIITDFQCKVITGGIGKLSFEPVGKVYGDLFSNSRPDCQGCWYLNLKGDVAIRLGAKFGGGIYLFRYTYLGFDKGWGYDLPLGEKEKLKDKASQAVEASAEAFVSVGAGLNATYRSDEKCTKPEPGLHGTFYYGRFKVEAKISVKIGPISFDPKLELQLAEGGTHTF